MKYLTFRGGWYNGALPTTETTRQGEKGERVMYRVIKRDGQTVEFDIGKIAKAITKAFEAILRSKVKKGLPSWHSIDEIQLEIDRMTNHHDRAFVLDMIYEKIDDINDFS